MEIAGAVVSFAIGAVLVVLVWMVTSRTIQDQRDQVRDSVQRNLLGQAAIMAKTVGYELLMIDQSLTVLQQAWDTDSGQFDLAKWKDRLPALTAVSDDLFIADNKRVIRQDILPQAVGQNIASGYVSWPHGSLERIDTRPPQAGVLVEGDTSSERIVEARRFIMYVARPLERPPGWIIGASYRTGQLVKLFSSNWFGTNALAGIVDMKNGGLQTIIGPAARRPERNLAKTPLFANMQKTDSGVWGGVSPIDDVPRIMAFYRIPNQDMMILVGTTEAEALAPAASFASNARMVGLLASGTLLVIAGIVAWAFYRNRANQRRERAYLRDSAELERLRQDEARLAERSQLQSARLRTLLEHVSDGVALVDPEQRLIRWNRRFEQGIGVPLEENQPIDAMLRQQAALGLFDPPPADPEAEIARRALALRTGEEAVAQVALGQQDRYLRGLPVAEGGMILLLTGVAAMPMAVAEMDVPMPAPGPTAAPIEW
jgi:PAS domain-containing protein